jgi:hypothetical protein
LSDRRKYRKFTAKQKVELVLALFRGDRSVAEICRERDISETLLRRWRDQMVEAAADRFQDGQERSLQVEQDRGAGAHAGQAVRGWANYFKHGVSKRTFSYLDSFAWRKVTRWLRTRHPRLNWSAIRRRFFHGWDIADGGIELFKPSTVTVSRYRYRGNDDPHALDPPDQHHRTTRSNVYATPSARSGSPRTFLPAVAGGRQRPGGSGPKWQPPVAAARRPGRREAGVGIVGILGGSAVASGGLVVHVGTAVAVLADVFAGANGNQRAPIVAGTDDRMLGSGRTVDEVPLPQGALLALDDQ